VENAQTVAAVARCIKTTRKQQGIRQQDLADLAGVSCRFLSALENGKETVELGKVLAVISTLGLEMKLASRAEGGSPDGR
jgi:HTH-type transcriptional regulator / antitoxin HipB